MSSDSEHDTQRTDAQLMRRYVAGDFQAFDKIYSRYHQRVYSYLCRRLPSRPQADDVFQNVFIKFHRYRARYDERYPMMAWIYTITRCELLDYLKRQRRFADDPALELPYLPSSAQCEDSLLNLDLEKRLSVSERRVLKLRYLSELTFKQIAARLRLSHVAVRQISSRGLRKLRLKYGARNNS